MPVKTKGQSKEPIRYGKKVEQKVVANEKSIRTIRSKSAPPVANLGKETAKEILKKRKEIKYSPAICRTVIAFMKKGYSEKVVPAHLGIPQRIFLTWKNRYPELSDAVEEGKLHAQLWWETLGIKAAQGKVKNFNAACWNFNMKNRFNWKDRTEVSGDDEHPVSVRVIKFSETNEDKTIEGEWKRVENKEPDNKPKSDLN